jgi:hypothetical protein
MPTPASKPHQNCQDRYGQPLRSPSDSTCALELPMVTSNADWLVMPRLYRERATASKNPALGYNWESRVDLSGVKLGSFFAGPNSIAKPMSGVRATGVRRRGSHSRTLARKRHPRDVCPLCLSRSSERLTEEYTKLKCPIQ